MAAIMSSGVRVAQEPQKIEDDVIGCACADHWLHMRSSWGPNPAHTTSPVKWTSKPENRQCNEKADNLRPKSGEMAGLCMKGLYESGDKKNALYFLYCTIYTHVVCKIYPEGWSSSTLWITVNEENKWVAFRKLKKNFLSMPK